MPVQRLRSLFTEAHIPFTTVEHPRIFTSGGLAQITHTPARQIAKTVMVVVDDALAMVVVPGSKFLDLSALKRALGAGSVRLAHEYEFERLFPDCELGAEPPFGNIYGIPVYVDRSLAENDQVCFHAGSHRELVRMRYADLESLTSPIVLDIATPAALEHTIPVRWNA